MTDLAKDTIKKVLEGSFYKCWADFEPNMIEVLDTIKDDSKLEEIDCFCSSVTTFIRQIERRPDIQREIQNIGHNYDADSNGISQLEWLVLVKLYLSSGDKNLFMHLSDVG